MREIKFRVYWEANINGKIERGIEGTCSRFILTQTGDIVEQNEEKEYKVLIPLFWTGIKDENGQEIYAGDIIWTKLNRGHKGGCYEVYWMNGGWYVYMTELQHAKEKEIVGNIYENPELLE